MTIQIDILNPKANKLLKDLADLNLISIRDQQSNEFMKVVAKLRKKATGQAPTLDLITKEVELVRAKRYAEKKS
jgi:polysaccharide pyruvyl transferase WcaK-like protein